MHRVFSIPGLILRRFFAGLGVLGLVYAGYWLYAAHVISQGVAQWIADSRAMGLAVTTRGVHVDGFPLSLRVVMESPSLSVSSAPDGPGGTGWSWRGSEIMLELRPWDLRQASFRLPGTYEITYPGALLGGSGGAAEGATGRAAEPASRSAFAFSATAAGVIRLDEAGHLWAGYIDIGDMEVLFESGSAAQSTNKFDGESTAESTAQSTAQSDDGSANTSAVRARRVRFSARSYRPAAAPSAAAQGVPAFDIALTVEGLRLPPGLELPLGEEFSLIQGEISLIGDLGDGALVPSLRAWRDAGGTIEVESFVLRWGGLEIEGEGTLALDHDMQPMGALTTSIRGFAGALDGLAEKGFLRPSDAATAKIVLGLMAKKTGEGGRPTLKVPLSVQEKRLYIGPVRLAELPHLNWR